MLGIADGLVLAVGGSDASGYSFIVRMLWFEAGKMVERSTSPSCSWVCFSCSPSRSHCHDSGRKYKSWYPFFSGTLWSISVRWCLARGSEYARSSIWPCICVSWGESFCTWWLHLGMLFGFSCYSHLSIFWLALSAMDHLARELQSSSASVLPCCLHLFSWLKRLSCFLSLPSLWLLLFLSFVIVLSACSSYR